MFTELDDLKTEIRALQAAMASQISLTSRALTAEERATLSEYINELVDDRYDHILSPLEDAAFDAGIAQGHKELTADRADYFGRLL